MKEIKIKAWDKIQKKMYMDFDSLTHDGRRMIQNYFDKGQMFIINVGPGGDCYDLKILQYTGLKDNTKWEQLSKEEKKKFYNENCSEDGRTIKYQEIDDVKHLWKGKEIYEGDIVRFLDAYDCSSESGFDFEEFENTGVVKYNTNEYCFYVDGDIDSAEREDILHSCEVIGNIYENPELVSK